MSLELNCATKDLGQGSQNDKMGFHVEILKNATLFVIE